MIAAKAFDPVLGVDVHIVQPPGPVPPVPVPHPFVGMLIDPMDFAPIIGSTVSVNGMPRATAGSGGQCIPPHIPIGGVFVKPPANECEVFMGSSTVLADGDPLSFLGMPALSCSDIGMPPIPRINKKRKTKSLVLPTSVVLSVPGGAPVLVGGPPTVSMMALGMRAAMAGLGRAFRGLRRLQRGAGRFGDAMRAITRRANAAGDALADALRLGARGRQRIRNAICAVTGHPVDIATGRVFTEKVDLELPGPIPFTWKRTWSSTSTYSGSLGHGWHHAYQHALYVRDEVVLYRDDEGRSISLPPIEEGQEYFHRPERLTLLRDRDGYALRTIDRRIYRFGRPGYEVDEHVLTAIEDPVGNSIRLLHDRHGRLSEIVDSGGRVLRFTHDTAGRIETMTAPHPDRANERFVVVRYGYDQLGNLVQVVDALGQPATYRYDRHLLVQETDRNGLSFYFQYDGPDEHARCIRTWGDGGIYDHKLTYDVETGLTWVENSLGHTTRYRHEGGQVVEVVDPLGGVTTTEYNEFGQKVKETDPLGHSTEFAFDDRGNNVSSTAADGGILQAWYDEKDFPVRAIDVVGGEWQWTYDEVGRVLQRSDSLGRITRFDHDHPQIMFLIDPSGGVTRFTYDRAGGLTGVVTPDGGRDEWDTDGLGRPIWRRGPRGETERREFDLLGRLTRIRSPDGNVTEFAYDGEGSVTRARDAVRDVRFRYTGTGRLIARTQSGSTIGFSYDTEEDLVEIVNQEGRSYRYQRDAVGRIAREVGFDGSVRSYSYDAAGRVTRVGRPDGRVEEYRRDEVGRVIELRYSDGEVERYEYRADSEVMVAVNQSCVVEFERDLLGNVIREALAEHWIETEYDSLGNPVRVRSSLGGDQRIVRDEMGAAVSLTSGGTPVCTYARDSGGALTTLTMPEAIRSLWHRDLIGRPTRHDIVLDGRLVESRSYEWGVGHRLTSETRSGDGSTRYRRDPRGYLEAATHPTGEVEYRVPDAVQNVFRTPERVDRTYGPSGELLEARRPDGIMRYDYDSEGNLTRRTEPGGGIWRYRWADSGNLVGITRPDGSTITFAYDAFGRRVSKTHLGRTTRWLWNGDFMLHEWVEAADQGRSQPAVPPPEPKGARPHPRGGEGASLPSFAELVTYLFEPDGYAPVAKVVAGAVWPIITDHLGTPRAMYDPAANPVWTADPSIYGVMQTRSGSDAGACPFRWPGQYEDAESGLFYNRFRYYDPQTGTYLSRDPIGLDGGLALYAYVHDPTVYFDYFGLADGGPYSAVRNTPRRGGRGEVHHTPANSVSPRSTGSGPSIWMTKADHRRTASHGSQGRSGALYRQTQADLIAQGNWYRAIEMDVMDITGNIGHRYDQGIREMLDYSVDEGLISRRQANAIIKKCGVR